MGPVADRIAAIRRVEEAVYSRLQEGRRPKLLAKRLFDLLCHAVEREGLIGAQLSRGTAAHDLNTTATSTPFKNAIDSIAEALARCRPDSAFAIPPPEDRLGVACVDAVIEEVPHLVFVRGPRSDHRGAPPDSLLRLEAEFRAFPRGKNPVTITGADRERPTDESIADHAESNATAAVVADSERLPSRHRLIWWIASGFVLLLVAGTAAIWLFLRLSQQPRRFFVLSIPVSTDAYYDPWGARISPDGSRIAFLARAPGTTKRFVFVREFDNERAAPIQESAGEYTPFFWSEDGRSVYFVTGGYLKRARLPRRTVTTIAAVGDATRGSANAQGVVLLGSPRGILRVLPGGRTAYLTKVRAGTSESAHISPYFLPDGETFLFLSISHRPSGEAVITLCSGRTDGTRPIRAIGPIPSRVEWNAGCLLYAHDGSLYARHWNIEHQAFEGSEFRVTQHVWWSSQTGDADFSVAKDGFLVVKDAAGGSTLRVVNTGKSKDVKWLNGTVMGTTVARDRDLAVLAISTAPGRTDLWIWDLTDDSHRKLTSFGANTSPVLTSSGEDVYFAADRKSFANIYRMSIATGAETLVFAADGLEAPRGISGDDRLLLFQWFRTLDGDLYCLDLRYRKSSEIAASATAMEGETGRFSPDGKKVIYVSNVSDQPRVYLADFPTNGLPVPISVAGGWRGRWASDGQTIYYVLGRDVMAYDIRSGQTREAYRADSDISQFEVTRRGEFLLVVAPTEPPNRIVSNWQQAVGRGL